MDIFVTPKLDKSLADQISPNYRKTAENRDRELSKVQRHILNTAAPLTVLHDLLEKSLCLLGNASNTVSTLRRSKVLYAINPSKISLAEALYPNAGTLLFGNDINKLAADSADISRNLQKNLASRQPSTQNYSTGANFQKYQPKKRKISPINPRNEQIRPWGEQRQISPTRQPTTALSEQEQRFPLTGRLRFFYNNWKKITLDPSILDIVLGYKIVFQTHPFQ